MSPGPLLGRLLLWACPLAGSPGPPSLRTALAPGEGLGEFGGWVGWAGHLQSP